MYRLFIESITLGNNIKYFELKEDMMTYINDFVKENSELTFDFRANDISLQYRLIES